MAKKKVQKPRVSVQLELAADGKQIVESIGELFISDRFITNCPRFVSPFSAARLERFTRGYFPRILLDPAVLDTSSFTVESALADLSYLSDVISKRPAAFRKLVTSFDNPERFATMARKLGLTETDATGRGGDLLLLIVALAACVVIAGCGGATQCGEKSVTNPAAGPCVRPPHGVPTPRFPHKDIAGIQFVR